MYLRLFLSRSALFCTIPLALAGTFPDLPWSPEAPRGSILFPGVLPLRDLCGRPVPCFRVPVSAGAIHRSGSFLWWFSTLRPAAEASRSWPVAASGLAVACSSDRRGCFPAAPTDSSIRRALLLLLQASTIPPAKFLPGLRATWRQCPTSRRPAVLFLRRLRISSS